VRKILVSLLLSTALSAFAVNGAHAKEVKLSGLHTQDQVRAACRAVGGVSWSTGGRYGCTNDSKGTQVSCTPGGECTGEVPGRIAPDTMTIHGVIAGAAKAVKGAMPTGGILNAPGGFAAQGPAASGMPTGTAGAPSAPRGGVIY
jgi:hypothetical protein